MTLLARLRRIVKAASTLVLVTHDPGEILPEINRIILLDRGKIIADGAKREILTSDALSELYGMKLKLTWQESWPLVSPVR